MGATLRSEGFGNPASELMMTISGLASFYGVAWKFKRPQNLTQI
jgi:hypothetical protein